MEVESPVGDDPPVWRERPKDLEFFCSSGLWQKSLADRPEASCRQHAFEMHAVPICGGQGLRLADAETFQPADDTRAWLGRAHQEITVGIMLRAFGVNIP